MMTQALGARGHDSLQYHVVCEDGRIFSARIFLTATTSVQWAWVYERGGARVLVDSEEPVSISADGPLAVAGSQFSVQTDAGAGGRLQVGAAAVDGFVVEYNGGLELSGSGSASWEPQRHYWQPDLSCTVRYRGERLSGRCFAKRYTWLSNAPRYWSYRMLSAYGDAHGPAVWSADALFEDVKHGNFKLLSTADGLWSGDPARTFHGDMDIHTALAERELAVTMNPVDKCERLIRSSAMDSRLVQWPVSFALAGMSNAAIAGSGIYEYICGTLG
jgi:hypothetical protein